MIEKYSQMLHIPTNDVTFHPMSRVDPNGRLFWWNGELYRAISSKRSAFYQELMNKGIIQKLIANNLLVGTELTSLKMQDCELILKHETIPFVSYAFEWCGAMLKDAAILIIDLNLELAKHELSTQDSHPWNILFDGPKPVYVDFGSIVTTQPGVAWAAYDEFCRFFYYPLLLMSKGHKRIARWLLHDDKGVLRSDLVGFIHRPLGILSLRSAKKRGFSLAKRIIPDQISPNLEKTVSFIHSKRPFEHTFTKESRISFFQKIKNKIKKISIIEPATEWSHYESSSITFSPSSQWKEKHQSVYQVLTKLNPLSVLDVGSNEGWFSHLACRNGSQVVAFDTDETCVTNLYTKSKNENLRILPLVMNFSKTSPGYGLNNSRFEPASDRLQCEMVLALALVHHLVFKQFLDFSQIAHGLSMFSKRWVLVEFIPPNDKYVSEWFSDHYSWYKIENFIECLKKYFNKISFLDSYPEPRFLVLCEK